MSSRSSGRGSKNVSGTLARPRPQSQRSAVFSLDVLGGDGDVLDLWHFATSLNRIALTGLNFGAVKIPRSHHLRHILRTLASLPRQPTSRAVTFPACFPLSQLTSIYVQAYPIGLAMARENAHREGCDESLSLSGRGSGCGRSFSPAGMNECCRFGPHFINDGQLSRTL